MVTLAVYHCNSVMSDLLYRRGLRVPSAGRIPVKIEIQLTWVFPFQQYVQTDFVVTQKSNTEHGSNNVVTIVKQLINSIKKRFHTKKGYHIAVVPI